jgi:hypothetical protein
VNLPPVGRGSKICISGLNNGQGFADKTCLELGEYFQHLVHSDAGDITARLKGLLVNGQPFGPPRYGSRFGIGVSRSKRDLWLENVMSIGRND